MSWGETDLGARMIREQQREQQPEQQPEQRMAGETVADVSTLTADEGIVLEVLAGCGTAGTPGQLRSRSGLSNERLGEALAGLRAKGLIARLNTVIESYSCRFPGIRVS